jgi:hypothetical protein
LLDMAEDATRTGMHETILEYGTVAIWSSGLSDSR